MYAQCSVGSDNSHIRASSFVRAVLSALIAVAHNFHNIKQRYFFLRRKAKRIQSALVIISVSGGSHKLMRYPCSHMRVVRYYLVAGIGCKKIELAVFAVHRKAIVLCEAFKLLGEYAVGVIRCIFKRKFISECAYLVIGQLYSRVLMTVVHLDIPRFLLVGN